LSTTKVRVPKSAGEEITISYAGDEPITYRVTDGTTSVRDEHLNSFLGVVEGSTTVGGTATASKE
jgi:hypothetical protein